MEASNPSDRAAAWKKAYERGIAGDLADRIVRERPVPAGLLAAIVQPSPTRRPTAHQLGVLEGLALSRKTAGEYAAEMHMSVETIKTHLQLLRAYYQVEKGAPSIAIYIAAIKAGDLRAPTPEPLPQAPHLTRREKQTLQLTAEHGSMRKAAATMGVSVSTVKFHLSAARKKLGARSTIQAYALAIRYRLI